MIADYHVQDGCHNCSHIFVKLDYDSGPSYYCRYKAPRRPKCGSVAMGENSSHFYMSGKGDIWDKWAEGREVSACGKCGKFKKEEVE